MDRIKIKNSEIAELLDIEILSFPKYVTQIINLANQNAQGTRPKVVGQMSELVSKSKSQNVQDWEEWYAANFPDSINKATDKIWNMIRQLKDAIEKIDEEMVKTWAKDLVIAKTYIGMCFQKAILMKVAEYKKTNYRFSSKQEESQGIDGWISDVPVSIKADTYKTKLGISEIIICKMIYYSKKKDGILVEFEDFEVTSRENK